MHHVPQETEVPAQETPALTSCAVFSIMCQEAPEFGGQDFQCSAAQNQEVDEIAQSEDVDVIPRSTRSLP